MSGPTPLMDKVDAIVTEVIDNAEDISATYMYSVAPGIDDGSWVLKVRSRREVDGVRQKFAWIVSLEDVTPTLNELLTDDTNSASATSVDTFVATILVKLKERTGFGWDGQLVQVGLSYLVSPGQPWILSAQAEAILGEEQPQVMSVPTSNLDRKVDELVTEAVADIKDARHVSLPQTPGSYLSLRHRDEFGSKSTAFVPLTSWFPTFELGAAVLVEMTKRTGQPWEGRFVKVTTQMGDWIPTGVAEGHLNNLRRTRADEDATVETLNSSMATKAFERAVQGVKKPETPDKGFRVHGPHESVWRQA